MYMAVRNTVVLYIVATRRRQTWTHIRRCHWHSRRVDHEHDVDAAPGPDGRPERGRCSVKQGTQLKAFQISMAPPRQTCVRHGLKQTAVHGPRGPSVTTLKLLSFCYYHEYA